MLGVFNGTTGAAFAKGYAIKDVESGLYFSSEKKNGEHWVVSPKEAELFNAEDYAIDTMKDSPLIGDGCYQVVKIFAKVNVYAV